MLIQEKVKDYQGIVQCLPPTLDSPSVFDGLTGDGLTGIIRTIVGNVDILNLGNDNSVDEYTFTDANARKLFLVFSWFITSVFGVKTKSKNTKVVSIGRTYLQLLRQVRNGDLTLFNCGINIPALPAAAPPAAVAAPRAIIDGRDQHVHTATGTEEGRLCLAYSSERIFRMAVNKYIKMDIDMNVTATRVSIALRNDITHQQYPVFATAFDAAFAAAVDAGITPQQYPAFAAAVAGAFAAAVDAGINLQQYPTFAAAVAGGINHQQYPAFAAAVAGAFAAAVDEGINPQQYNAAAIEILYSREATQQNANQHASNDVQQVRGTNTISFNPGSLVFNQEIFSELITRFSHLPRGNQYILDAARYMQPIMLQICEFIDRRNPANIRETIIEYMNSIRGLPYPYRPALHDTSKFTMLNDGMRDAWLQYLINKILLGENEQTIFDNMKLFVLLYNYIGPVNGQIIFPNPYNVNYRTRSANI